MWRELMRARPAAETALALVALFAALSGSAVALKGKNSVDSGDIKNGQVKSADLAKKVIRASGGAQSAAPPPGMLSPEAVTRPTLQDKLVAVTRSLRPVDASGPAVENKAFLASRLSGGSAGTRKMSDQIPGAMMRAQSVLTVPPITGAPVQVPLNTMISDSSGLGQAGKACVAGKQAGVYNVSAGVLWESYPHGHRISLLVKNENNVVAAESTRASTDGTTSQSPTAQIHLGPGDCLSLKVMNFAVNYNNIAEQSELDLLRTENYPFLSLTYQAPGPSG